MGPGRNLDRYRIGRTRADNARLDAKGHEESPAADPGEAALARSM
jgi:hypothetical protein